MRILLGLMVFCLVFPVWSKEICRPQEYLQGVEGRERLSALMERGKNLMLSKLEELGIDERQTEFKLNLPKSVSDTQSLFSISLKSKVFKIEGTRLDIRQKKQDDTCAIELSLLGGNLINIESGKDFGGLGRVKELIRIK